MMMYRMNSYNAHFSFARAQHTASDKPMIYDVFTSFLHGKYGHLTPVTCISREQMYRGARTTLPDH
eukprot:scaffold1149_cov173-Skeletonema_marinoi.AAC.13